MKQLTYIKKNRLEWWDVAEPQLQSEKDAIVRPIAAARCDGDKLFLFNNIQKAMKLGLSLHLLDPITNNLFGQRPFNQPIPIGHECVAEIIKLGNEVTSFDIGDKVIVPWSVSCGVCPRCSQGLTSKCINAGDTLLSAYGFGPAMGAWGGMICDSFRVPFAQHMLVAVPQNIAPASLASASDNIPDAWRTVAPHLKKHPGSTVLIVGGAAESIGLYAAAIAVAMGAQQVDYLDYQQERLDIAQSIGAVPIPVKKRGLNGWFRRYAPRTNGDYFIAVDASANPNGLRFAIRSLAPGGICTSVGFYFHKGTKLPLMQMYSNCTSLHTGLSNARADLPELLELIKTGKFSPEKITSLVANWEDAHEAYLERTTKVVIQRDALYA